MNIMLGPWNSAAEADRSKPSDTDFYVIGLLLLWREVGSARSVAPVPTQDSTERQMMQ